MKHFFRPGRITVFSLIIISLSQATKVQGLNFIKNFSRFNRFAPPASTRSIYNRSSSGPHRACELRRKRIMNTLQHRSSPSSVVPEEKKDADALVEHILLPKQAPPPEPKQEDTTAPSSCETACSCPHDHDHDHDHGHHEPTEINLDLLKVTSPTPDQTKEQSIMGGEEVLFVNQSTELDKITSDEKAQLVVWRQNSPPGFVHKISDPSLTPSDMPVFEGMILASGDEGTIAQDLKSRLTRSSGHGHSPIEEEVLKMQSNNKSTSSIVDEDCVDQIVTHVEKLVRIFGSIANDACLLDAVRIRPNNGQRDDDDSDSDSNENEEALPFVYLKLKVFEGNGCAFWHQDCVPFRMVSTFRGPCTEWIPPAFQRETLESRKVDSNHMQKLSHCDVALFKGRGDSEAEDALKDLDVPGIVHRSPRTDGTGVFRLVMVIDIPQRGWHFQ